MSQPADSGSTAEDYYAAQWAKPEWSQAAPNRDEADRWAAMQPLVVHALEGVAEPGILDLGCGRGWLTALLSEHGETLGIDPLEASVQAARSLFPHLAFRCATAGDLLTEGREDGRRFHLVVASEVIEHVPDRDKAPFLAAARELLAPGGHLLLTTPRGVFWEPWRRRASRTQPVEEWVTEGELDRLAREAGLVPVARDRAHLLSQPLSWHGVVLQRVLARRGLRRVPLPVVRRWLDREARFYQVGLWRREAAP